MPMMMTSATTTGSMTTMTEEELARHDSKTLLQLLLSADARCDDLTAERDKYESAWMTAEGKLADVEAERDRLREALEQIEITCEEEIRARTAGMSEAALGKSRILPILQVPRNIARAALKGESHD